MLIGEITRLLMDARGLNLEALAARVRAAGAPNVKYQHIQQLLDIPTRRPRFLPELARAFGMNVEEFLSVDAASVHEAPSRHDARGAGESQPLQPDPAILAASYQLVRLACKALGEPFNPEDTSDAQLVTLAYDYLAARDEHAVTATNVVDFTAFLRKRHDASGAKDEREGSTGSTRTGTR